MQQEYKKSSTVHYNAMCCLHIYFTHSSKTDRVANPIGLCFDPRGHQTHSIQWAKRTKPIPQEWFYTKGNGHRPGLISLYKIVFVFESLFCAAQNKYTDIIYRRQIHEGVSFINSVGALFVSHHLYSPNQVLVLRFVIGHATERHT